MSETERFQREQRNQKMAVSIRVPSLENERDILRSYQPNEDFNLEVIKKERENSQVFLLEYGSKSLLLYYFDNNEFVTVISNNGNEKVKGDTTEIYSKAKEIMQQEANQSKKSQHYEVSTKDPKMTRWANSKGKELFHWKNIIEPTDEGKDWVFVTKIEPSSKTRQSIL